MRCKEALKGGQKRTFMYVDGALEALTQRDRSVSPDRGMGPFKEDSLWKKA